MGEGLSDISETSETADSAGALGTDENVDQGSPHERVELLIDELRKRTSELEQATRELRRVSHYRSLFLARMSHELRTPLTSILGFSEILLDHEQLTETQRRFCQKVQDSGFQLQASLNQLVDLSRIEAGETEVFLQEFSLRETLRESCAAVTRMARKQQGHIEYEIAPEITTIVSDEGKLRQVLFNFISWAVGRGPSDHVVNTGVTVVEPNVLSVKVSDTGPHISDQAQVFDPEDKPNAREPNINELGIIIGRKLVELMEGSVTLQNRESVGLEAEIRLLARPLKG